MRGFRMTILVMALFLPSILSAAPITFQSILSGSNENPATGSPGTGTALIVLDPVAQTLQLTITFSNLTSNAVAAHIHCCIAPPSNTGVATTIPAFPGFPLGFTSGTYTSPVFDLTQSTIYNPAFVTAQGGLAQAEATFVAGIQNGQTYLNIHTVNFGGGEIRGFLTPVAAPEPSSLVLIGSAVIGLVLIQRRQWIRRRS